MTLDEYLESLSPEEREKEILAREAEQCEREWYERQEELREQAEADSVRFSNLGSLEEQLALVEEAQAELERAQARLAARLEELDVIAQIDDWKSRDFTVKDFNETLEVRVFCPEDEDLYSVKQVLEGSAYCIRGTRRILARAGIFVVTL